MLVLVGGIALLNVSSGDARRIALPTPTTETVPAQAAVVPSAAAPVAAPPSPSPSAAAGGEVARGADTAAAGAPSLATTASPTPADAATQSEPGALLPKYRIVAYYGHPGSAQMGILGEYDKDTLLAKLKAQASAYQALDPSRPVMPAFELIASVAQGDPGNDGTWVLHTGPQILNEYADFTAAHGIQLILDVQIGRSTVQKEIEAFIPWLERPNVQLALDPEFAMAPGQVPGKEIGGIDASDILYAQNRLAQLSKEKGIPPKILIVHQFYEHMIRDRSDLHPVPGVQLVIDVDGFGAPSDKIPVYNQFNGDGLIQYAGIKLFYKQDDPLMTPQDVLALNPKPDVVIYQ